MSEAQVALASRELFSELISRYAQAWSSTLDRSALEELYAPDSDLIFYDAILPKRFTGRSEMIAHGAELFAGLASMQLTPTGDVDARSRGEGFAWTTPGSVDGSASQEWRRYPLPDAPNRSVGATFGQMGHGPRARFSTHRDRYTGTCGVIPLRGARRLPRGER